MKKNKGITLIALVITIIILIILAGITIGLLGGEEGLIAKAKEAGRAQKIAEVKEKISLELLNAETEAWLRGETLEVAQRDDIASKYGTVDGDILTTTGDNYEIDLREIYNKTLSTSGSYTALKQAYETASSDLALATTSQSDLAEELQKSTATTDDILTGKKAYVGGTVKDGTMTNNGAVNEEIGAGEEYTVPAGYHNGSGKVKATAPSLAEATAIEENAADASKILKDYKAYVNGQLVEGTMVNNGAVTDSVGVGGTYTIPEGYHNGSGTVKGPTLSGNATAADVKSGKTFYSNSGTKLTGTYTVPTKSFTERTTLTGIGDNYKYLTLTVSNIQNISSMTFYCYTPVDSSFGSFSFKLNGTGKGSVYNSSKTITGITNGSTITVTSPALCQGWGDGFYMQITSFT